MRRLQALFLATSAAVLAAAGGCGEGGSQSGATVSVYAAAPLCIEAKRELEARGGEAGDLAVRVLCVSPSGGGAGGRLAAAGANARRATEDSTSVAFLEAPGPAAEFSQSIVEAAGIAWLKTGSGSAAMRRVLRALDGDGSSPREAVLDEVG